MKDLGTLQSAHSWNCWRQQSTLPCAAMIEIKLSHPEASLKPCADPENVSCFGHTNVDFLRSARNIYSPWRTGIEWKFSCLDKSSTKPESDHAADNILIPETSGQVLGPAEARRIQKPLQWYGCVWSCPFDLKKATFSVQMIGLKWRIV